MASCVWVKHTPLPSDLHQLHCNTCQRHRVWCHLSFANLHTLQKISVTEYVNVYFNLEYQHGCFFKSIFNCYILYLVDLRALTGKSRGISRSGLTATSWSWNNRALMINAHTKNGMDVPSWMKEMNGHQWIVSWLLLLVHHPSFCLYTHIFIILSYVLIGKTSFCFFFLFP